MPWLVSVHRSYHSSHHTQNTSHEGRALGVLFTALSVAPGAKPSTQQVLNEHLMNGGRESREKESLRVTGQGLNLGPVKVTSNQGASPPPTLCCHLYTILLYKDSGSKYQESHCRAYCSSLLSCETCSEKAPADRVVQNSCPVSGSPGRGGKEMKAPGRTMRLSGSARHGPNASSSAVTGLATATMAVADNPYDDEQNDDVILPLDVSSQSRDFPQPRHCPVSITATGHDMQEVLRETEALSNFTSPSTWSLNSLGGDPYYLTCSVCLSVAKCSPLH